jgi:hypothetical protein
VSRESDAGNAYPALTMEPMKETKQGFAVHPFMEKILSLRATDKRAWDSLSPATKLTALEYEKQKREAERLEAIRNEPAA